MTDERPMAGLWTVLAGLIMLVMLLGIDKDVAYAAMVRGKLERGAHPAPYVTVTLFSPARGRSAPAITSAEGMYHLYNVPAGEYTLEFWTGGSAPMLFTIVVREPYTDVAPIRIP